MQEIRIISATEARKKTNSVLKNKFRDPVESMLIDIQEKIKERTLKGASSCDSEIIPNPVVRELVYSRLIELGYRVKSDALDVTLPGTKYFKIEW